MIRTIFTLMFSGLMMMQAQAQASKTFVKTIAMENATGVVLAVDGPVTVSEWNENYLRVEMTVTVTNFSEYMLKQLAEAGRYKLESVMDGSLVVVSCPKLARKPVISGTTVNEEVGYRVFVPKGVAAQQTGAAPAAVPATQTRPAEGTAGAAML
jgi:hypothetical protein